MDVYLNVCSEYSNKKIGSSVKLINESVENHGLFQKEVVSGAVETHLKEINVLLQSVKTRHRGFKLLLPLIQQGSPTLIEKRCDLWFGACCQAIILLCGSAEKIDACKIIIVLLKAAAILPELQKTFLMKSQTPLLQSLVAADSSWNSAAFECLYELIKLIPGQCLPQKTVIEERMLKYLASPLCRVGEDDIVKKAGRVYAVLPLPGMGGNKALGKAEARGRQLTQLIALAHKTMDFLFEGVIEKESYEHTREHNMNVHIIRFDGSSSTVSGFLSAVTRLGNVLKFMSQMLITEGNQGISVVPCHILSPVFRLLQVDSKVLKAYRSQEHQILSFLIVSLHHHCLWLLRDMILSIGESIDIYYGVISELLVSLIKTSLTQDNNTSGWCTKGVQTRIMAYSLLTTVLQVSRGRHAPSKVLSNLLVNDLLPKSQQITLQKNQNKGLQTLTLQKKKKKKGYVVNQTTGANLGGPFFQSEVVGRLTRAALTLTETLFIYASHSMPHKVKQVLQKNITRIVETVSGGASLPIAYSCDKTRAQMYRTLASIATHPDPRCPPPYTVMLHLLQLGLQDQQMLVVTTCQTLMGNISFIIANPKISLMDMALRNSHNSNRQDDDDDVVEETSMNENQHNGNDGIISDEELVDEETDKGISVKVGERDEIFSENGGVLKDSIGKDEGCLELEEEDLEVNEEASEVDEETISEVDETEIDIDNKPSKIVKANKNVISMASKDSVGSMEPIEEDISTVKKDIIKLRKCETKERNDNLGQAVNTKRKALEESPVSSKKNKNKDFNTSRSGPSLEEMLGDFVDADPDE